MTTTLDYQAELRRFTYKPGWRFWIETRSDSDTYVLSAEYSAPDSSDPDRVVPVRSVEYIPGFEFEAIGDWRKALRWRLERVIYRMELHERDEWFRYDGALINDPHAGVPGPA